MVFTTLHDFNSGQVGLAFLSMMWVSPAYYENVILIYMQRGTSPWILYQLLPGTFVQEILSNQGAWSPSVLGHGRRCHSPCSHVHLCLDFLPSYPLDCSYHRYHSKPAVPLWFDSILTWQFSDLHLGYLHDLYCRLLLLGWLVCWIRLWYKVVFANLKQTVMGPSLLPLLLVKVWLVSRLSSPTCHLSGFDWFVYGNLGNITALSFPLFTEQMYSRLGIPWANTLFAFIALLLMPIPFVSTSLKRFQLCSLAMS